MVEGQYCSCLFLWLTVLLNNTLYLSGIYNLLYNTDIYNLEERGSGLSIH